MKSKSPPIKGSCARAPKSKKPLPKVVIENGHVVVREASPVETPAAVDTAAPEVVTTASRKGTPKKAKPEPKEKAPKEDLCVFALRMTMAERTKLHETAGPAKASRFARAILAAAANRDEDRIREIIEATRPAQ
jgi:hypothetical protein